MKAYFLNYINNSILICTNCFGVILSGHMFCEVVYLHIQVLLENCEKF